ncbi:MAG: hypothetical protein HZA91_08190 [Verrucomicrobia bacterium]|nr:hypothetical protein [Verrucomicrobiota bacterium]
MSRLLLFAACASAAWLDFVPQSLAQATNASSDVVGYQFVTLRVGRNLVALSLLPASNTVAGVLGSVLPAGATESTASAVDFWGQSTQTLTNRSWLSTNTNFPGWRAARSFADANALTLDPAKGFIITLRQGQTNQDIFLTGSIALNSQTQVVRNNGYTLAGSTFPVSVPLTNSALVASGFIGGSSLAESDSLLFFNPVQQAFDTTIWYDAAGTTWRNADGSAATRQLTPGEAFLIKRLNRPAGDFTWTNPLPYNLSQLLP